MGGVRSSLQPWLFALSCVAVLSTACGRTSKRTPTPTGPEAGAGGEQGVLSAGPKCAVSLAANRSRHCATYQDGSVWCWGPGGQDTSGPSPSNFEGSSEPKQLDIDNVQRVVLGPRHSCAVKTDGSVWCWGDNESAQIDDTGVSPLPPTPLALAVGGAPAPLKGLGLGEAQTCMVNAFSHVYCRGQDPSGPGPRQIDVAGELDTSMPGSLPWVMNEQGVVFNLSPWQTPTPVSSYGRDNAWVGNGNPEACLLKRWGSLWCTDYDFTDAWKPKAKVALGEDVVQAGTGELFACALTRRGQVWCQGFDQFGQTGDGTNSVFSDGAFIPTLSNVRSISVNGWSACALEDDGTVWCWGEYAKDRQASAPVEVSGCVGQTEQPSPPNPFAGLTRSSADRLAEAGRARGEAVCSTGPASSDDVVENCVEEEDFSSNADCVAALGPGMDALWNCRADGFWAEAACFAKKAAGAPELPCPIPPTCGLDGRTPVEAYCRRRGCSGDLEQSVKPAQLCDGTPDCNDGSDERNCDRSQHSFDCGGSRIALTALCDGKPDCADGSDETYCQ